MTRSLVGRAVRPRRWIVGSIALISLASSFVPALPAATAQATDPLVRVGNINVTRGDDGAVVTARVNWNADGVSRFGMTRGDLRLLAVSEHGHLPTLLGKQSLDISTAQTTPVTIKVGRELVAAMHRGNRVVLTASQHAQGSTDVRSPRTYVTVAEVQPFGSPQPNIGRQDCSAIPVVPGAMLKNCDLVGAYFDKALVSIHDAESHDCTGVGEATCMIRADLTGATGVGADFSGVSIAGGRINGMDLSKAKLDNLSLAGTDAVEVVAVGATSDAKGEDSGANFYRTRFTGSDLRNTVFLGISIERARLDGTALQGATWQSIGRGASFHQANLTGAKFGESKLDFADFQDATLTGASLRDDQLQWTVLCRTVMPSGSQLAASRDCRTAVESNHLPFPRPDQGQSDPYVTIDQDSLVVDDDSNTVAARISWDSQYADAGMDTGDLRLIAVDGTSGVATVLDKQTFNGIGKTTQYTVTIKDARLRAAMTKGNRVVLTATQHEPPSPTAAKSRRSFVTVDVLQKGPGLGQVGKYDCSRVALTADSVDALDYCDLSGAMLDLAALNGRFMRMVDLSGATMRRSSIAALTWDGAHLGSLDAAGAYFANIGMFNAWAPKLDLSGGFLNGSKMWARNLDGADFSNAKISDSPFTAASLRGAVFTKATFIHQDMAYADLLNAKLDFVDATQLNPSLFLANLVGADMTKSIWIGDESGQNPWQWATLCSTTLPDAKYGTSGDRDCPR
ncbi:MAG: pentapeptide repeat-containing protein [Actinomycetota bacterium]|nr:pentapeptide repeat-containing protein [Actinomycetota bacterium]